MNFLTKIRLIGYSYNFEKDYIKKIIRNLFGICFIILAVFIVAVQIFFGINYLLFYVSVLTLILGIFVLLTGDIDAHAPRRLSINNLDPHKELACVCTNGTYGDYYTESFNNQYFVYSDLVNSLLNQYKNKVVFLNDKFELDEELRKLAPFALQQFSTIKNSKLFKARMRLCTDLTPGKLIHREKITVQESDYFSGLCSNELALKEIYSKDFDEPIFNGLSLVRGRDLVTNFEDSRCANLVGINTLLLTSDGKLICEHQDSEYADNYQQLVPSISESLEYPQVSENNLTEFTLQDIVASSINEALEKKYGFNESEISTFLVGYARLLNRGGKPEFFAISITTREFDEICHNQYMDMNVISLSLVKWDPCELSGMANYISTMPNVSIQLYLNCAFLSEQLIENEALQKFLFDNSF